MAYDRDNPPSLVTQAIGGPSGLRFFSHVWNDTIAAVLQPGYVANAADLGMREGDSYRYEDITRSPVGEYWLIVSEIDADGSATLVFPALPEEAVPDAETFDDSDPNTYVVIFQDGVQKRLAIDQFSSDTAATASQAEAEAGTDNTKRMTPLRTNQAFGALDFRINIGLSHSVPRSILEINPIAGQDDATVDTDAFNELADATRHAVLTPAPAGYYKVGIPTIPTTLKHIEGRGDILFKPPTSAFTQSNFRNKWDKDVTYAVGDSIQYMVTFETIIAGLSPTGLMYKCTSANTNIPPDPGPAGVDNVYWQFIGFDNYFAFTGDNLRLYNIGFDVDSVLTPHVRTLALLGCHNVRTQDLYIPRGGGVPLYGGNCTDVQHRGFRIEKYAYHGGQFEGVDQRDVAFVNGHVETTGVGTAHGLVCSLGKRAYIDMCVSKNAGVFGMAMSEVDQFLIKGISIDSQQEGMNTISGKNGKIEGSVRWDSVLSIDFGVSIDGTTGSGVYNVESKVIVDRSGVSALCMTGAVTQCTAEVIARDCNQTGAADEAGILFSGTDCQHNTGVVTMVDHYGPSRMPYAIAEINKGNGAPSNNTLVVRSSVGHLTSDALRAGPTSKIFGAADRSFVPVLSDGSNNPIAATVTNLIQWNYAANGVDVDFRASIVPTSIGSATGNIMRATSPVAGVALTGAATGRQSTTGKDIGMENTSTHLLFQNFDSSGQPAVNGQRVTLRGSFTPSV